MTTRRSASATCTRVATERGDRLALLPEGKRDDAGLTVRDVRQPRHAFNPDTRHRGGARVRLRDESLGAEIDWERIELGLGLAVPVRKDVVWMTLAGGSDLDTMPLDRTFMLGGPGSFPGFELGELRVTDYWTASGSYLWKIKDIMSIRGQALYAGMRLDGRPDIRPPRGYVAPGLSTMTT
jgi:hypothetical protein